MDAQKRAAQALLEAVAPSIKSTRSTRSTVVSGFDLKFIRELAERLDRRSDLDVVVDEWPSLARASGDTESYVQDADSIIAEWARPSAAWLSEQKTPDQFFALRLHRFEIETDYPRSIAIDDVDAVVYIAPNMGRRIRDELGWPSGKLLYIPNYLNLDWLNRSKLPGARFSLGLVGMLPNIKRLDLALDLISQVRNVDPRFSLFIRSVMPWHNQYVWGNAEERDYYSWCFERIEEDPLLRGAVVFDPPGRDMARWYRGIGHILSPSDVEGSHTSVAEGMASGAVPVVRPWAGAMEVYGQEWIHASVDAAVSYVLECADSAVWEQRAARARAEVARTHDALAIENAWADLLHRDVESARSYFASYARLE